jgi:hypothetical protein
VQWRFHDEEKFKQKEEEETQEAWRQKARQATSDFVVRGSRTSVDNLI